METDLTEAGYPGKTRMVRLAYLLLALPVCLSLSGCIGGGSSAVSALAVDKTTTAAISPLSAESEIMSDETVIRDLVGNLGQDELAVSQPWSNSLTGSAGVISNLSVIEVSGKTCRLFETTRHSFDGVALFDGKVCRRPDGGWDLIGLDRSNG